MLTLHVCYGYTAHASHATSRPFSDPVFPPPKHVYAVSFHVQLLSKSCRMNGRNAPHPKQKFLCFHDTCDTAQSSPTHAPSPEPPLPPASTRPPLPQPRENKRRESQGAQAPSRAAVTHTPPPAKDTEGQRWAQLAPASPGLSDSENV